MQLSLLIMGGGLHWGNGNHRWFNYLSDFAENWLKGVCVYACEIDTQSDHSFVHLL